MDGLGSKLIEQLVDRGLVRSIADLYGLDGALLASLERMGSKSAENLVAALTNSKASPGTARSTAWGSTMWAR